MFMTVDHVFNWAVNLKKMENDCSFTFGNFFYIFTFSSNFSFPRATCPSCLTLMLMLNNLPSLKTVKVYGLSAPPCLLSLTRKPPFLFTINNQIILLSTHTILEMAYILTASALPTFYRMTCTMVEFLSPPSDSGMTKNCCYYYCLGKTVKKLLQCLNPIWNGF